MTTDIKELATLIRLNADMRLWPAADALEAMAGEVERLNALIGPALEAAVSPLRKYIGELQELNKAAEAERDRLAGKVASLKETITTAEQFNEGLAAERDRLKAALLEIKADPIIAVAVAERALKGDA